MCLRVVGPKALHPPPPQVRGVNDPPVVVDPGVLSVPPGGELLIDVATLDGDGGRPEGRDGGEAAAFVIATSFPVLGDLVQVGGLPVETGQLPVVIAPASQVPEYTSEWGPAFSGQTRWVATNAHRANARWEL